MRVVDSIVIGRSDGATLIANGLAARGEQVLQLEVEPSQPRPAHEERIALRPRPLDLDGWAAHGLPNWTWEACLPALCALETDSRFDAAFHGRSGPVHIRRHPKQTLAPWQSAFLSACAELGFERCEDLNAPGVLGYGPLPMSEPLAPSGPRQVRALPRRVLFDDRRVAGLELELDGSVQRLRSPRVVLCGGVPSTLGLLLRSGVGPAAELSRLGVDAVRALEGVGARLQLQASVEIGLVPRRHGGSVEGPRWQTGLRWSPSHARTPGEVWLLPGSWMRVAGQPLELLSMCALLTKPRQRLSLRLDDADPRRWPRIDGERRPPDPDDVEQAAETLELAWLAATSSPMRGLARHWLPTERVLSSRRRLRRWIRSRWTLGTQLAGTATMGPDEDPLAVTDPQGRVRGLEGLWIGDASVMPSTPGSDLHLSTLLIAQRLLGWLSEA